MDLHLKIMQQKSKFNFPEEAVEDYLPTKLSDMWKRTFFFTLKELFPSWVQNALKILIKEFYFIIGGSLAHDICKKQKQDFGKITLFSLLPKNHDLFSSLKRVDSRILEGGVEKLTSDKTRIHTIAFGAPSTSQIVLVLIEVDAAILDQCKKCPIEYAQTCQQFLKTPECVECKGDDCKNCKIEQGIGYFGIPGKNAENIWFVNVGVSTPSVTLKPCVKRIWREACRVHLAKTAANVRIEEIKEQDKDYDLDVNYTIENVAFYNLYNYNFVRTEGVKIRARLAISVPAKQKFGNENRETLKPMDGSTKALLSSILKKLGIEKTIGDLYSEKWKFIE